MSWPKKPLGPLCLKIGSGVTPRGGEAVYQTEGVSLIRSQNVYNSYFAFDGLTHITDDQADAMSGVEVTPDDVLLNITGDSVARCCRVPKETLPARVNQHVSIIRPDPAALDSDFLCYFLTSPFMQSTMLSLAGSGGTRKALTKSMIEKFAVPIPELDVQKSISMKLRTYDDLLANNQQRIDLLERSARILFKEWFVKLRYPGHEHDKIVAGVPHGWRRGRLSNLGLVVTGKTPSKSLSENFGLDVPFIKTPDMRQAVIVIETEESLSERGAATQEGKTLPKFSTLVSCIGTVGIVALNGLPAQTNQQINSIIPARPELRFFNYCVACDLKPRLEAIGGGVTMANVNKSKFESLPVLLPTESLLHDFDAFCDPIFEKILLLESVNRILTKARNLLLPRLMDGRIAV